MNVDTIAYLIMCLFALSILSIYLYFIYKEDKIKQKKYDLYFQEIIKKLDNIERSNDDKKVL